MVDTYQYDKEFDNIVCNMLLDNCVNTLLLEDHNSVIVIFEDENSKWYNYNIFERYINDSNRILDTTININENIDVTIKNYYMFNKIQEGTYVIPMLSVSKMGRRKIQKYIRMFKYKSYPVDRKPTKSNEVPRFIVRQEYIEVKKCKRS